MTKDICKFFNTGFCKYKERCKFVHAEEVCEGKCNTKDCCKRHPKSCKFGEKCQRKEVCAYKHLTAPINNEWKVEVEVLKKLVEELRNNNKQTQDKVKDLESEVQKLKAKVEEKAVDKNNEKKEKDDKVVNKVK